MLVGGIWFVLLLFAAIAGIHYIINHHLTNQEDPSNGEGRNPVTQNNPD